MQLAVIATGGKQYLVKPGDKIKVEKLAHDVGSNFEFDKVLLVINGKDIQIGRPYVEKARVKAKVLEQGRADKKIIFHFKSKTRHKKKAGHRQPFTKVEIGQIV